MPVESDMLPQRGALPQRAVHHVTLRWAISVKILDKREMISGFDADILEYTDTVMRFKTVALYRTAGGTGPVAMRVTIVVPVSNIAGAVEQPVNGS